jgi:hypothetical protein
LLAAVLLATPVFAGTHTETVGFSPGGTLRFSLKGGDVHIMKGADPDHIVVRYTPDLKHPEDESKVQFVSTIQGSEVEIAIKTPMNLSVDTEIEVPSPVSLHVDLIGGDLKVEGVEGDKDLRLFAGDIRVELGKELNLHKGVASSRVGDVDAPALGKMSGWLGHTWKYAGAGQYSLYAHTNAGDVSVATN